LASLSFENKNRECVNRENQKTLKTKLTKTKYNIMSTTKSNTRRFVAAKKNLAPTVTYVNAFMTPKMSPTSEITKLLVAQGIINTKRPNGNVLTPIAYKAFASLAKSGDKDVARGAKFIINGSKSIKTFLSK
jgi:hypothetical protein